MVILSHFREWAAIRSALVTKKPYNIVGLLFSRLSKLLQNNKNAFTVEERLVNANANTFSGILGNLWKNIEGFVYFDNKLYIRIILQTKMMARN